MLYDETASFDMEKIEDLIIGLGEMEEGEFYKHSMLYAEYVLDVTDGLLATLGEEGAQTLRPFLEKRLSVDGTWDYENGWERGYDPIKIYHATEVVIPARVEIQWVLEGQISEQ